MILGFFWARKYGKYIFGWLDFCIFSGIAHLFWPCSSANNVQPNLFCFLEMLKAWKFNLAWNFFESLFFGPEMFWDFVGSLRDFFGGFDFWPVLIIPVA